MARRMQRSRAAQPVSEETVAAYTAARAFLMGEWFGASLSVASILMVFLLSFVHPVPLRWAVGAPLGMFAVAAFAYLRNRAYYERLDFRWATRWHNTALVVAGAGAFFWLLFAFLLVLVWFGVDVAPMA